MRGAADDRRGDDVQLVAVADIQRRAVEAGRHDRPRERGQHAHQHERLEDRQARVDACQLRGVRIAAVGVDVSAEAAPRRDPRHDDRHADEQNDG